MIFLPRQKAILGLIAFNAILTFLVVHLTFFAAQGGRCTAENCRQDRANSLSRDTNLAMRIGELERKVAEHTHN